MKNPEQLNRLADNLKKLREAASKNQGVPAPAQAQPEIHDRSEAIADLEKENAEYLSTIEALRTKTAQDEEHIYFLEQENSKLLATKEVVHPSDAAGKPKGVEKKNSAEIQDLQEQLTRLNSIVKKTRQELTEALTEVQDISEAAAGGMYELLRDIEVRLSAYAAQRAANPSLTLIQMILADENLDVDLRNVLREILAKYII